MRVAPEFDARAFNSTESYKKRQMLIYQEPEESKNEKAENMLLQALHHNSGNSTEDL